MSSLIYAPSWSWSAIAYGGLGAASCLYLWEYLALRRGSDKKPSLWLVAAKLWCRKKFEKIGEKLAIISSFLTYIHPELLVDAFVNIASPSIGILASPIFIIWGYIKRACEYKYPLLIGCGTCCFALLCWVSYNYGCHLSNLVR